MATPIFRIKLSDAKNKKYAVTYHNKITGRNNTINFGDRRYKDFTQTGDEEKKRLYLIRHAKDADDDLTTAGTWSKLLLWNKRNIDDSVADIERKFGIEIRLG